jgi:hypothetical protein
MYSVRCKLATDEAFSGDEDEDSLCYVKEKPVVEMRMEGFTTFQGKCGK